MSLKIYLDVIIMKKVRTNREPVNTSVMNQHHGENFRKIDHYDILDTLIYIVVRIL